MNRFPCFLLWVLGLNLVSSAGAQGDLSVASGPMIGHVSMRSAQLWIQTTNPAPVFVQFKAQGEQEWRQSDTQNVWNKLMAAHLTLEGWSRAPPMRCVLWSTVKR